MNNSKNSLNLLRTIGCLIFDIALILAYFKGLGLFILIFPIKSILILFVLFVGIIILNVLIIYKDMIFERIGIPYSASFLTLSIIYIIVSNFFSVIFISGSAVWYTVWQLVIFAVFLFICSLGVTFSKRATLDVVLAEKEQIDKTMVMAQLLEIENILSVKQNQDEILQCIRLFKKLKERICASTPFGRISGNREVIKIENQIKDNLETLKLSLEGNLKHENIIEMERLIENIRRLVINRETLNVK